jgi:hypothetical protein
MEHEGMVHALEQIRRLLKPDGILVNILPVPEGSFIEAVQNGKVLFSKRKRENWSEDVLEAEAALKQVFDRELFVLDQQEEFDFLTYGSSVSELRAYWEEQDGYEQPCDDEAHVARVEELYAQVDDVMQASGPGAEVVTHERARIARLRPVR